MSKDKDTWNEEEWGPLAYREFTECPNCGCPNRFSLEGLRREATDEKIKAKPPALGAFEFVYDTAFYRIKLAVVVDSCCKCGTIYTIARSKTKSPIIPGARGGDIPGLRAR